MPDPILNRAAIIRDAIAAAWDATATPNLKRWSQLPSEAQAGHIEAWMDDLETALPVITAAVLAPLRARHRLCTCTYCEDTDRERCAGCHLLWPCDDVQLLDAIEAAVKGGE